MSEQEIVDSLRKKENKRKSLLLVAFWVCAASLPIAAYFWWQSITEMMRVIFYGI